MAGRKKGPPQPPLDGERGFAVVVEQLRDEFKVFGAALGGLRQEMNAGIGGLRQEMNGAIGGLRQEMNGAIGGLRQEMNERFGDLKCDMGDLKQDLAEVKVDVSLLKTASTTHGRELKEIRSALGNKVERGEVEAIVEHVVARTTAR